MDFLDMTRKNYYLGSRPEVTILIPNYYSRVLEIGCGEGGFRRNLPERHEYWGIEPVSAAAELAKENLDKVFVGTFDEVASAIPENYFDLIICNDVIEHMPDHDKFLESIKTKMTEKGKLIASVPNVRYLKNLRSLVCAGDWQYQDGGVLDRTHLRFFTKKSLIRVLVNHEFTIDLIIGLNYLSTRSLIRKIVHGLLKLILGNDIMYLQFGIQIQKK